MGSARTASHGFALADRSTGPLCDRSGGPRLRSRWLEDWRRRRAPAPLTAAHLRATTRSAAAIALPARAPPTLPAGATTTIALPTRAAAAT